MLPSEPEAKKVLRPRSAKKKKLWGEITEDVKKSDPSKDAICTNNPPGSSEETNTATTEDITKPKTKDTEEKAKRIETNVITIACECAEDDKASAACFRSDPKVLRTVELLRYRKLVSELQEKLETEIEEDKRVERTPAPDIPSSSHPQPNFITKLPSNFNDDWCHAVLRKSVATLCCFLGFENADSEALEYLTDLTGQGCQKMSETLKTIVEKRAMGEECGGTKHPVSHLMQIEGIGKIADLRDSYDRRFVDYPSKVETEVLKMKEQYDKLIEATFESPKMKRRKREAV